VDPIAWKRRDALALAAALLAGSRAWAQGDALRGQQIKLVVPFTPGSGTDVVARIVADSARP
jgi:tripartite-type tricarboxylate transporter receptor subunit TctC